MPSSEPEDQLRPPPQTTTGEPSGPQDNTSETSKDAASTGTGEANGEATGASEEKTSSPAEPAWPPSKRDRTSPRPPRWLRSLS